MQRVKLTKSIGLILLVASHDVFSENNVCHDKFWLQSPIVEAKSRDESGIGGTGFAPMTKTDLLAQRNGEEESGIGGTGIVGVISGFGSICVNGVEIHYDQATQVIEEGNLTPTNNLALGQTVSILATSSSQNYYAKEIRVLHEVQGVVDTINLSDHVFTVLGQTVNLPETLLEKLTVGDNVVVSGNRLNDGSIDAARVEKRESMQKVSVIGALAFDNLSGTFHIEKQPIEFPENQMPLQIGDEVGVQGVIKNGVLHVEKLEQNPRLAFSSRVEQLLLQGYVRQGDGAKINVDGMQITIDDTPSHKMPKTGERVGVWVKENEKGRMVFERIQRMDRLQEHLEKPFEHKSPRLEKEEIHHSEMDRQNSPRPELNHPDIQRPNVMRPDIDKPTLLHLENNRPNLNQPNVPRPEINHLEIERPAPIPPRL